MQDWTGVEVPLGRFIELCRLAGRMRAPVVTFLPDGTCYLESPVRPRRQLHGDYVFLSGICTTDRAMAVPTRELEATFRLLGLARDRPVTVRGQTVRLAPGGIIVEPQERRYRRRLLAFPVGDVDAERLTALSVWRPEPNLGFTPDTPIDRFIPFGRARARLSLAEGRTQHMRGDSRSTGTATIDAVIDITSRPGRALLALCEHLGSGSGQIVAGHFTGDVLFLWTEGVLARIQPNLT